jgi:hypothetical protein
MKYNEQAVIDSIFLGLVLVPAKYNFEAALPLISIYQTIYTTLLGKPV